MRTSRTTVLAAAAYVAATILFTWPLPARIGTHFPAGTDQTTRNDTLLLSWAIAWDVHQLLRDPLHLFEANIFHPLRHTLGYSETLLSEALLVLPLAPRGSNPALLHNTALLLSFVLGGLGTFLLVRHLSGDRVAAFLAGLMFAFAPYRFWQINRINALSVYWTPFLCLALHRYLERGGGRRAALLGAAFVLQCLASVYVAYESAVLLALFLLGSLAIGPAVGRRRVLRAAGILCAAGAVVALVYAPYAAVRSEMAFARDPVQVILHSVVPAELGRAVAGMPGYLARKIVGGERGAGTLGFVAAALMWLGIVAGGRSARLYALLALAALLLSFGPVVVLPWGSGAWVPGPYRLLHDWAPGFTAMREPRRWTGLVVACGTVIAGLGTASLLARVGTRGRRVAVTAVIAALITLEVGWRPQALDPAPTPGARLPLYRAIARSADAGAVAELPIGGDREEAIATFRSAYHFRPVVNGYSSFRPTTADLRRRLRRFPDRRTVGLVRRLGVRFVLYDMQRAGARSARSLARRLGRADPSARLRASAGGAVLVELEPSPPILPAPGTEVPRRGWHARASEGDAAAVLDGDLATQWSAPVDPDAGGGWIEVDLGQPTRVDLVRLELGSHYGEYPRTWRVRARDGDREWQVAARRHAPAPLESYRADPRHVIFDVPLPPTTARVLRIEVPRLRDAAKPPPFDVAPDYWQWSRWGVHELRLYRRAGRRLAGRSR